MSKITPEDQPARERIRTDLQRTLFVEAGAGTGKTTALVARVIQTVACGEAAMADIAAITFTELAAAELRDRIRAGLERASAEASNAERDRLRTALGDMEGCAIQTIHGFAQRLLAEHPLESGLPPLFDVMDAVESSVRFEETWLAFQNELLNSAKLETPLLRAFALGLTTEDLRALAGAMHGNRDRLPQAPLPEEPAHAIGISGLADGLRSVVSRRGECLVDPDRMVAHLRRLERHTAALRAAEDDLDRVCALARLPKISCTHGKEGDWPKGALRQIKLDLKGLEEQRAALLSEIRGQCLPPILNGLRAFVLDYARTRQAEGRLEFHDLLLLARDLLTGSAEVRQQVRRRYRRVLVDEFQDTDPVQTEIVMQIAGDNREKALFFVGDPKQSIYRFRHADISQYRETRKGFTDGHVSLTQNFRSVPSILDWVNAVFPQIMVGGDGQAEFVALRAGRTAMEGASTVFVLGGPAGDAVAEIRNREAAEIAQAIRTIRHAGWSISEAGPRGEQARPARYSDMALLFPTRTTIVHIEFALEQAGIPYRVESRSLLFGTQEIRDVLSILRAIDDPSDEVCTVAALRSPGFACGDDNLLAWSQRGGGWNYLQSAATEATCAVSAGLARLRALHQARWKLNIGAMVQRVIADCRLMELSFAAGRPRERWQRYRYLVEQARAFGARGPVTLRQFADWADRQREERAQVTESVVPEPDDDAVRIMTVHTAKGLEFPVVLLAGLNTESKHRAPRILWSADGTLAVRLGSETRGFFEIGDFEPALAHDREADRLEKLRLLYVAATRARDHLVVSLHHGEKASSSAALLHPACATVPELWRRLESVALPETAVVGNTGHTPDTASDFDAWEARRAGQIARLTRAPRISATSLARHIDGDPEASAFAPDEGAQRKGRAGTSIGRATHAVLQVVDLQQSSGEELESLVRAQTQAEGVPDDAAKVTRMVRSALRSAPVLAAVRGRHWRELYLAVPVDGVTVEGFIDLLYETEEGLVIVDYKTDRVSSESAIDVLMARYEVQALTYALAVTQALSRPVIRCELVFVSDDVPRVRTVTDIAGGVRRVREKLVEMAGEGESGMQHHGTGAGLAGGVAGG